MCGIASLLRYMSESDDITSPNAAASWPTVALRVQMTVCEEIAQSLAADRSIGVVPVVFTIALSHVVCFPQRQLPVLRLAISSSTHATIEDHHTIVLRPNTHGLRLLPPRSTAGDRKSITLPTCINLQERPTILRLYSSVPCVAPSPAPVRDTFLSTLHLYA